MLLHNLRKLRSDKPFLEQLWKKIHLILVWQLILLLHGKMFSLLICFIYFDHDGLFFCLGFLLLFCFYFQKWVIVDYWGFCLHLRSNDRLVVVFVSEQQSAVIVGRYFLFDGLDDAVIYDVLLLVWSKFVQFLSLLLKFCHHFILFFGVFLQLFENGEVLSPSERNYLRLSSFGLSFVETILEFGVWI